MSLYTLFTGRAPDSPLGPGGTTMSRAALNRWSDTLRLMIFAMLLSMVPMLAMAQNSNPNLDFGMNESDSQSIMDSVYSIWRIVANVAVYGGGIVAIIGFLFGFGARVFVTAAIIALIGGFGEWAMQYILGIGGMEVLDRSTGTG